MLFIRYYKVLIILISDGSFHSYSQLGTSAWVITCKERLDL